jgi:hypothetical protein
VKKVHTAGFLLGISALVGIVCFIQFITPRSEQESQWILGLSATRIFVGIIFLGLLLINIGAIFFVFTGFGTGQNDLREKSRQFFLDHYMSIMIALCTVLTLVGIFMLSMIPPVVRPLRFVVSFYVRLESFITWIFIAGLLLLLVLRIFFSETVHNNPRLARQDVILTGAGLFVATFLLYFYIAVRIGWVHDITYAFWDLLAGQFIEGKLYLENPPYSHDLTLYNGKWYVPMPPLPAILLMPIAYWVEPENINTSYASMFFSAVNGVLIFLILRQLAQRKWIELPSHGMFWLVVVFLFGTPHLWVGIDGRGWYISQILTVLFLALAVYAALRTQSAWWSATFIGIAMLARPNSLMTWPFVFAISMQILKDNHGSVEWKQAFQWVAKTIPPIAVAVIAQLSYNYLRFEDFLDFGYTTVNAGKEIVSNVQTYGLFSPHFIPQNIFAMFFRMPRINWGATWSGIANGGLWPIDPTTDGMSMLVTTPILIYLFCRYPKQWWVLGAWAAILFNLVLLSFYSNTGAYQFGYRYVLDFIVPLIAMLAVGMGKKVPWHYVVLVLVSILINTYGAYWYMNR